MKEDFTNRAANGTTYAYGILLLRADVQFYIAFVLQALDLGTHIFSITYHRSEIGFVR